MSQILEDLTISGFRGFREINLSDMGNNKYFIDAISLLIKIF